MKRLINDLKYNFKKDNNGLVQLILINVVVFVILGIIFVFSKITNTENFLYFIEKNIYLPAYWESFIRKPWTLVTYSFIHSLRDLLHIIFNMLFLYWFGRIIQEYIGSRRLVNIYLLGGIIGGIFYLLLFNLIPYFKPMATDSVLLGASGSVFAVAVAAATLVPDYTFFLFFIGSVRIIYIVGFFILISFLGSVGLNAGGNICHLGGALFGFIYIIMLRKGIDLGQPINWISAKLKRLRNPHLKVSYRKKESDEISQKDIDAILDKINRSGYESLTKEEKQKLYKASQK